MTKNEVPNEIRFTPRPIDEAPKDMCDFVFDLSINWKNCSKCGRILKGDQSNINEPCPGRWKQVKLRCEIDDLKVSNG